MNLSPYVQFGGRCAQAFQYYKVTWRGSPMGMATDRFGLAWMIICETRH